MAYHLPFTRAQQQGGERPAGPALFTPLGTAAALFPVPPQHPFDEGAGGDDLEAVLGGVIESVLDDGLADFLVAHGVRHVGVGEIERLGARFRINEVGFLTTDGGEEPAAPGVVADHELHGVTLSPLLRPVLQARRPRHGPV